LVGILDSHISSVEPYHISQTDNLCLLAQSSKHFFLDKVKVFFNQSHVLGVLVIVDIINIEMVWSYHSKVGMIVQLSSDSFPHTKRLYLDSVRGDELIDTRLDKEIF
jgi:hypothetical protein